MKNQFVLALFDLTCTWKKISPVYRVYVNDELFSERRWRWRDHHLTEILQIAAPPGQYTVKIQPVGDVVIALTATNHRIDVGPGRWNTADQLEILDAS